jgi:hypothetical protein
MSWTHCPSSAHPSSWKCPNLSKWNLCCGPSRNKEDASNDSVHNDCEIRTEEPKNKFSLLLIVSRIFSRRPFLVLFLTLSLAGILCKFGLSAYGFPEFEDPYLV